MLGRTSKDDLGMSPSTQLPQRPSRHRLRAKLVRTAIGTLSLVTVALILTVAALNLKSSRSTLRLVESDIRERIARKGRGLVSNHARAMRRCGVEPPGIGP
jgi:hypothetical protein